MNRIGAPDDAVVAIDSAINKSEVCFIAPENVRKQSFVFEQPICEFESLKLVFRCYVLVDTCSIWIPLQLFAKIECQHCH